MVWPGKQVVAGSSLGSRFSARAAAASFRVSMPASFPSLATGNADKGAL